MRQAWHDQGDDDYFPLHFIFSPYDERRPRDHVWAAHYSCRESYELRKRGKWKREERAAERTEQTIHFPQKEIKLRDDDRHFILLPSHLGREKYIKLRVSSSHWKEKSKKCGHDCSGNDKKYRKERADRSSDRASSETATREPLQKGGLTERQSDQVGALFHYMKLAPYGFSLVTLLTELSGKKCNCKKENRSLSLPLCRRLVQWLIIVGQ